MTNENSFGHYVGSFSFFYIKYPFMQRLTLFILVSLFLACSNGKMEEENESGFSYKGFSEAFRNASLPFQLSDTLLLKNKDTSTIHSVAFAAMIPDSVTNKIFGKKAKIRYIPLWKVEAPEAERYFIVKAVAGQKKTALLLVFNEDDSLGAVFPFLVPDADASTFQVSGIDKAYSISRAVIKRRPNDVSAEGKDVYVYNKDAKQFTLIMTDPLDDKSLELINPIDTLSKQHKLAGDYVKDKRNIVSIRDGRSENTLTVFIHIEKDKDCTGEIKGDVALTSPTTAVYRQSGDPCILQLTFTKSSVKLTEVEGCGSRRGLECRFEGSFPKKIAAKAKGKSKKGTKQ